MSDIDIEVESGDLKAAIELLGNLEGKFIKTVGQMEAANRRLERASKASSDVIGQAFDKVVGDKVQADIQRAKSYWSQYDAQLGITGKKATDLGASFSALDKEIQSLTAKYAPLTAAAQYYHKEVDNIKKAHALGLTTLSQYEKQLQSLTREYETLQKGAYLAGSRFNQFGEMAGISGKFTQRFGMYAQQAGYQIGDFAVQVQNGTNAGVAFSQQAAQLAGLIPGVGGAIATFSAIGLGMLIQNLTASEKEAKKAKESYSEIGSILDQLESTRSAMKIQDNLVASAQMAKKEYKEVLELIEKVDLSKLKGQLAEPLSAAKASVADIKEQISKSSKAYSTSFGGAGGNAGASVVFVDPAQQKALRDAQNTLYAINLIQGDTRQKLEESYTFSVKYLNSMGLMTPELQTQLANLGEQLGIKDRLVEADQAQAEVATKLREAHTEILTSLQSQIREQRQSTQLQDIAEKYGKQSLNYVYAEKEIKLQNYQLEMELLGLSGSILDQRVRSYEALLDAQIAQKGLITDTGILYDALYGITGIDLSGVFSRAQAAADGLLSSVNAIGRGLAQLGKLQQQANVIKATNDALKNGASPKQAKVAGDTVAFGYSLEGVPDFMKPFMKKVYSSQATQIADYEDQNSEITKAYNKSKGGGSSGKGSRGGMSKEEKAQEKINEKYKDFLKSYELNITQQKRLVGVFGEQKEKLEKVIEIENRLGDARVLVTDKQIEAWAKEELALQQKLENEKFLYDLGADSFKSFLDTVITGTESIEDAFKSMTSNIIKDLYDKYVGQYAADVAGNFFMSLFSANGNAFGAGGVKMFAKGGVVDSPTAFRYSGGLGVMGEAGPEAIMPLKRNSQGKLGVQVSGGSNGDVNVSNHFNISANGDDSVVRIIKSQMPQIEKSAVRAVIAAKRKSVNGL